MFPADRDLSVPTGELILEVRAVRRERLDRYLLRALGWKSRTRIQKLIEVGRVDVNAGPVKPAMRVSSGDRIRVRIDPGGEARPAGAAPLPPPLWEDAYLVAVDKPPGRLVHPVGRTVGGTILNELHHRYRATSVAGARRVIPKLCHRLDRDTSGVLLVAKTDAARRALQQAFEDEHVDKEYLAIVEGVPAELRFRVELPIAVVLDRTRKTGNRLARIATDGKPACTDFEVVRADACYSVVRCIPHTGRQNQIRAHLAATGHPILGDTGYGSDRSRWRGSIPFPERPLLHSALLAFTHPIWGTRHVLRSAPPEDFRAFL